MILRKMLLPDFEEVVSMYYDFYREVYPNRKIGDKYFFYKRIMTYINDNSDIILAEDNGKVCGFSLSFINMNGGLTEKTYNGEIVYVKERYRKGRSAYLLYDNVSNYAKELGLTLVANGLVTNGVSDMISKHFDCKEMFINFERKG